MGPETTCKRPEPGPFPLPNALLENAIGLGSCLVMSCIAILGTAYSKRHELKSGAFLSVFQVSNLMPLFTRSSQLGVQT